MYVIIYSTSSVQNVSSHHEYLKNQSHTLDVTQQLNRRDLTMHMWTDTLPYDYLPAVQCQWDHLYTMWSLHIHNDQTNRLVIYCTGYFGKTLYHLQLSILLQSRFSLLQLLAFIKAKINIKTLWMRLKRMQQGNQLSSQNWNFHTVLKREKVAGVRV